MLFTDLTSTAASEHCDADGGIRHLRWFPSANKHREEEEGELCLCFVTVSEEDNTTGLGKFSTTYWEFFPLRINTTNKRPVIIRAMKEHAVFAQYI